MILSSVPIINPKYGWKNRPCPDQSKKVWHLYLKIAKKLLYGYGVKMKIRRYRQQGLVKGAELCLNPYFFGWLEK